MKKSLKIISEIDFVVFLLSYFVAYFFLADSVIKVFICTVVFTLQVVNFITKYIGIKEDV
ncbi:MULTISPECIES: hypothetical protein [Streptococcus]|uniref:hypothetical protein n=1 Tax=Streptococcus TaxID=1301 RepID=UPI00208E3C57|nr:hypothetical protein [Streptococcus infantarius]MCO4470959.1 hypothetical protein [Streptococcus infantarius subsp. infantarius]MCO4474623.1 hypothetical protein [Streptococcus infantarius subsp. infantarius]MCO4476576.1 hypothetical protein [Streptococcus infantarius subsp. infantarius]MCO4478648.1 hypothetical protein [Streptococcus infantarius subsp. infantarius]MCO4496601.1 hypothetical protein [Streptococcus infantarius subsp. infantarius]